MRQSLEANATPGRREEDLPAVRQRWRSLFCLLAGGGDTAAGLVLLAAPGFALRVLGLGTVEGAHDGEELVWLRFVGVFVACVGLAYLYPWLLRDRLRRDRRLVAAFEMTAGVRLAVALFLGVAVAAGALSLSWLGVGGYDAVLALAQLGLIVEGTFAESF